MLRPSHTFRIQIYCTQVIAGKPKDLRSFQERWAYLSQQMAAATAHLQQQRAPQWHEHAQQHAQQSMQQWPGGQAHAQLQQHAQQGMQHWQRAQEHAQQGMQQWPEHAQQRVPLWQGSVEQQAGQQWQGAQGHRGSAAQQGGQPSVLQGGGGDGSSSSSTAPAKEHVKVFAEEYEVNSRRGEYTRHFLVTTYPVGAGIAPRHVNVEEVWGEGHLLEVGAGIAPWWRAGCPALESSFCE